MTPAEFIDDPNWADFLPEMDRAPRVRALPTHEDCSRIDCESAAMHLKRGGTLAPYRVSFFDGIASIECIAANTGTSGRINADNPNIAVTLKDVSGPLTIDSKVTATITGTLGAKASDILAGQVLTSVNALTFASGSVLALDQDAALTKGEVYTIATSTAGVTGRPRTPALTLDGLQYRTAVSDDEKSLELKPAGGFCLVIR